MSTRAYASTGTAARVEHAAFPVGRRPATELEAGRAASTRARGHDFAGVRVEPPATEETASGGLGPEEEEVRSDTQHAAEAVSPLPWPAATGGVATGIATTLRRGRDPATFRVTDHAGGLRDQPARSAVAPGGTPATDPAAASNDCLPSTASAVLAWSVVSADDANWRVDVTSLTLVGQINISPWPSVPNRKVVPNTPNPVDGGNINNTAGSANRWQAVIDDLADYDTAGGGAGVNWHSTAASTAHETAHWTGDYVGDAVTSAAGGNWSQANTDLDALQEPKATSATAAAARTAVQPRVNARLATWRSATISRWNTLIDTTDSPGSGGRGYAAGTRVLTGHITAVRAYAQAKGWTGTP